MTDHKALAEAIERERSLYPRHDDRLTHWTTFREMVAREDAYLELLERVQALEGALRSALDACDQGRMVVKTGHGIGGMTLEANIRGSVYIGVPAWPIEEARAALAALQPPETTDDT